jgi:hypothetical protein
MAERRKIVIETGEGTDEPLPTPHFDAEATLTARPVVPLNDQDTHQLPYGGYAGRAPKPFWKRPALLVAIVLAAIGVGVAAGLAIGLYRNRNVARETPVATAPTPAVENTELGQTVEPPPASQERVATVSEQPEEEDKEEAAVEPKEEERERTTARNERRDNNDDEVSQPVVAKPPVVRDKKPIKVDEYTIEDARAERHAEKERRREERRAERRERRRRDDEATNIPRGIQRAGREVDRIREIFEGRQP